MSTKDKEYDVIIIGSGAGGGTLAQELSPLVQKGLRILLLEKGPRFLDHEFNGKEMEMTEALYEEGGGFLTHQKTMNLAFGKAYGGSTVVYTGTSLTAPKWVIDSWDVPGLDHQDILDRSEKYTQQNNIHLLEDSLLNDNNRLFRKGSQEVGYHCEQFPLNLRNCQGSSLCNLGCPNQAKQGTNRVQLPLAENNGVEVVTRAEVFSLEEKKIRVRIHEHKDHEKGLPSEWSTGDYTLKSPMIVLSAGVMGSPTLLLKSPFARLLPQLGKRFTCHPALILVGKHPQPITNDVGHPKSFYVDRAQEEGFVLETCMYFPFVTAKSLSGFGKIHQNFMDDFSRLQMILVLACDPVAEGNQIRLDSEKKPRVDYHFSDEVIQYLISGSKASSRIFFAAGAEQVHAPGAKPCFLGRNSRNSLEDHFKTRYFRLGKVSISAAHLMGGCSMGHSINDSVTDSWGRVHGLPWLRIADASLFPNSLKINPYLTIMALANRVAEGILKELDA